MEAKRGQKLSTNPASQNESSSVHSRMSQRKRKRRQRAERRSHMRQTTLIQENDLFAMWGDPYILKEDDTYRFVSQNIDGLGVTYKNSKADQLKDWMYDRDVDCVGLQEMKVNWNKVTSQERIYSRLYDRRWETQKHSVAHNIHDSSARFQYGGTCTMAMNHLTHYIKTSGVDSRNLGRWSWLKVECKDKTATRIVTAYCPCVVKDPTAVNTVYQQQKNYLLKNNISTCPLVLFQNDLIEQLQVWISEGDRIILMMDVNADVGTSMFVRDLADIGIVSALRRAHKGPYPATYNRGSSQIDDIFVSASLPITQCGLFPFGDAPGDHRGVYVDIPITAVESETRDRIQRVPKRRLVTSKPKVVKKFNELFLQQRNRNHIPQTVEHLKRTFHVPLTQYERTQYERTQYEKIDRIILSAFRYAEKRCRKLKCGKVEY